MWASLERFSQDIRFAMRLLRKSPGFAAVAILTLALGVGANTAIFSITDSVLLRPLPYPDSKRLIRIWQSFPRMGEGHLGTAPPEFAAYRDRTRAFSHLAGYQRESLDLTGDTEPEHVSSCRVTASLFPTLGIAPLIGRTFTAQEELPGAAKVVVLSYQYWSRHYAGDPHIIGKVIHLNEQGYQIIGVMPRGFTFPSTNATPGEPPDLWTPLSFTDAQMSDWASSFDTSIIARLRNDVSVAQARDDVRRVATQFQQEHANIYSGNIRLGATAEPWSPDFEVRVRVVLLMLCGAVGFVLLIACANIANLLLARAGARQREISIRRALGASAARLARQVFTETGILAVSGSVSGCALAYGFLRLMDSLSLTEINLRAASIDARVLLFTLGLSGVTCLLCGLAPAWAFRRRDVNADLKQSGRQSGTNRSARRMGRTLILAEIACSVVLLIGAGLLLRSFIRILQVPLGFDPEHALIVRTTLNRQRYASPDRRHTVERFIQERLSSLPGVAAVALTTHVPLADERQIGFAIDGQSPNESHWADNALVSENYFRVMGIRLLRGRTFSDRDLPQAPLTAVVNQTMATQYWAHEDPIGKGFTWGSRHLTVVGVVSDVHVEALDKSVGPMIYNSLYQVESGASTSAVFIIRTNGQDPRGLAASARNVIWSVDHGLPILEFTTLHQVVSASLAIRRTSLALIGAFAFLAMTLSLIGIYGVLSHAVAQRTQEMGVRMALGAKPAEILRFIISDGVRLAAWGIVLGTAGAAIAGSFISKLLYGVPVLDPISFSGGAVLLFAVAMLASYLPARRASRVDPVVALRYE